MQKLLLFIFIVCTPLLSFAQIRLDVDGDGRIFGKLILDAGNANLFMGADAGLMNTTGIENTFIGFDAGRSNTEGAFNIFLGRTSGFANTMGNYNTFIGVNSGASNTIGNLNTFIGNSAGFSNLSGEKNTFIGRNAGVGNITGLGNTATGMDALLSSTEGNYNVAYGWGSLFSNTTGSSNVAIGTDASRNSTTAHSNVAIGDNALRNNEVHSNLVAVGDSALYNNGVNAIETYHSKFNTALGSKALFSNTTGSYNTAIGYQALYFNDTYGANTAVGYKSLYSNQTGYHNTAIGYATLESNDAGYQNVANGYLSLYNNENGYQNTAVGFYAFYDGNNYHNSTAIGHGTVITSSNQVRLGNFIVNDIGGHANWSNISDARLKKTIKNNVPGLEFITRLKPVTYVMDMSAAAKFYNIPDSLRSRESEQQKAKIRHTGFIAQEVEAAAKTVGYDFSGVSKPTDENGLYALRYAEFVVPLVKAVQEQQAEIELLEEENSSLTSVVNDLEKRLSQLEALMAQSELPYRQQAQLSSARLDQNQPNPFSTTTFVQCYIPEHVKSALLKVSDANGRTIKTILIEARGETQLELHTQNLGAGDYFYSLILDEQLYQSKKMILSR